MSMKILSLDSSATSASVCVYDASEQKIIAEFYINTKLTHSQTLVPMIDAILKAADISLSDIDYFAVNTGPGSFTGIRIGVSVIKGMAQALKKPCISVSTLTSMAYNFIDRNDIIVCGCMDARRNQVYNSLISVSGGQLQPLCVDRAIKVDELLDELKELSQDKAVVLVGDGAHLVNEAVIDNELYNIELSNAKARYQCASSVAMNAADIIKNNASQILSAAALMPTYLRPSQAERERLKKEEED